MNTGIVDFILLMYHNVYIHYCYLNIILNAVNAIKL